MFPSSYAGQTFLAAVLVGLTSLFFRETILDFQVHDTYFVAKTGHFLLFPALTLGGASLLYLLFRSFPLSSSLVYAHLGTTVLCSLVIAVFCSYNHDAFANGESFAHFRLTGLFAKGLVVLLVAQVLPVVNVIRAIVLR